MATTITPSSATPAAGDAINLTVAGAPANTATGYQTTDHPYSPAILYYISLNHAGHDSLVSETFTPDSVDGGFVWQGVVVPIAGVWAAQLRLAATDVSVANATITAS